MCELGLPRERGQRALHAPLPAVRAREGARLLGVPRGERGQSAQALALGRSLVDVPRQARKRATTRRALALGRVEERTHLVVERARLPRPALVVGRLADEHEQLPRARARRVEEVAIARERIGPGQPASLLLELAPEVVGEERRLGRAAREDALLEAEYEDRVETTRPRAHEVE